jgi:hypothetical protein
MRRLASVALVVLLPVGCSEGPKPPDGANGHQLSAAGSGTRAGSGGADIQAGIGGAAAGTGGVPAAAGAANGGSAGARVTVNAGAPGSTLTLSPAPSVNLTACSPVTDDGSSQALGNCFLCCAGLNLINSGFFSGACACASESADGSACTAEPDADFCDTCCNDRGFRGASFSPGPPTNCVCHGHTNAEVCKPNGANVADCAVCCINAGYVSKHIDGGCVCDDG